MRLISKLDSLIISAANSVIGVEKRKHGLFAVLALLLCLGPLHSYAQQLTIDYSKIVNAAPVTHSGMSIDGVIESLKKAQRHQVSQEELASQRQEVNRWLKESKERRQKANATRLQVNEMLKWGLISYEDAKSKYDGWVRYTEEAVAQLSIAQTLLGMSTGQNQVLQNLQAQVEPFLEPYAFLLEDVLETVRPKTRRDLVDLANLFPEGAAQPAWADLVRTRRYFVLSDGHSYARIFVQGSTPKAAYDENYKVLRHIIGWLWDSTKVEWTVDVYAYQNDLINQSLKLEATPHTVRFNSLPPPPADSVAVDLHGIGEFLRNKHTLEGAYFNDEGTLVLYGSKASKDPTLEGQPIGLADLAVAYRAVAYSGRSDAYISLDPSPYPEQVNVNFGGRLADTRMGWVVLRSDMRFKTLSDGFDPLTGEYRTEAIRKVVPDFKTQAEREVVAPKGSVTNEYTRYWFSPDAERLVIATNSAEKLMKISSPRFTGNAVREDGALGNTIRKSYQTPSWTRDTLANLNRNYNAFATIFPELRELDDVGRLLALFTWLKQKNTRLDLESLLAIDLPECKTPRRKPQMLVGYSLSNRRLMPTNLSGLADEWANLRPTGNDFASATFPLPKTIEDVRKGIYSAPTNQSEAERIKLLLEALSGNGNRFSVIAGGIDLNLAGTIAKPRTIPRIALAQYQRLKRSPTGEIRVSPTRTIARAGVMPVVKIEQPKVAGLNHAIGEAKPDPTFGPTATTRDIGRTKQEITRVTRTGEELKWSRQGTRNRLSDEGSRLVYYGDDNAPLAFVRYDRGAKLTYKLSAKNDTVIAEETISPGLIDEIAVINRSLQRGEATSQTWRGLPEDTKVFAFEKLPNNETAILRSEAGEVRLGRYNDQGVEIESLKGDAALMKMNAISRARITEASTDTVDFVHASTEGDKFILRVGKRTQEVPLSEIEALIKNPLRKERSPIDDLFQVPKGTQRDFVIYRDALARRPTRFGGSVNEGSVSDPAKLVSLFRQRYRGTRILLDDETDAAKKNLSTLQPIKRASEVGLIVPEKTFEIRDFDLIKRIKDNLSASGMVLIDSPQQLRPLPNVLIVAGHNDSRLVELLTSLGEQGLLKDKVLLLNTCYDKGNPNLFHDLIQRYEPKGVFLHTEKISDVALDPVLKNLGEMLRELESRGESIHPADLFEKAVDRTLENPSLSERQKLEINKLRKSCLQVSYVRPLDRPAQPAD
jgi:hypothetical protein